MEYKIGEVSKITNISKEMIRYYEKQGALSPSRKTDNNYRTYSTMDVFLLMEIVRYQALKFSVKDITELLKDHYYETFSNHLLDYYQQIEKDINYQMLLKERVKVLAVRSNHVYMNMGNFWIKKIPDLEMCFLLNSHGDDYDAFGMHEDNMNTLFKDDAMLFFESMITFDEEHDTWYYSIRKKYADALSFKLHYDRSLPAQFCLCTIVDMGEIGEFSRDCLNGIYQQISDKGYKVAGIPRGIIIGRGYENGKFHRIMEIQVPIEV